jgi:subtilase family protein
MSEVAAIIEGLRVAQQMSSLQARAPSDVSAVRYALETKTTKDPASLLTSVQQALPGLTITVERVFVQATDEELARFFHLEIIGITWDAIAASPFDLAYYLGNELDLASCEPRLDSTFPVEPATVHESPVVESAIIDWFGCFKDERVRPDQVDKDVLWALDKMDVRQAWAFSEREGRPDRGAGIIIAQPDTGVAEHEELSDGALDFTRAFNIFTGDRNVRDPLIKQDPLDQPGHGTGTSSVAISREELLIVGSAPKATLVPIRCIESVIRFDQVPVAQAVDYARRSGCHVITMSLGGIPSFSLRAALRRAVEDNLIVMAAAGNCVKLVVWPARYGDCIAVAATTFDDERWIGSCRGDAVDISAPGEFVWRAKRENGDTEFNIIWPGQGTSFAVALTAGVAALWLAHFGRDNLIARLIPGETLQARFCRMLMASARRVPQLDDDGMGAGVVDARALLELDPFVVPAVIETAITEAPTRASSIRLFIAEIAPRPDAEGVAGVPIDDASLVRYGQEIAWRALKRRTQAARSGVAVEAAAVGPPRSAELSRFVTERAPWLETSV